MISRKITKKINKILAVTILLAPVLFPVFTYAQNNTPPTTPVKTGITYDCANETGRAPGDCNFQDLVRATKRVVDFGVVFTLEFSVIVIAYAGFKYMISGDNPGERKKANEMLRKVAIGIGFILAAWLIVTLILNALGVNSIVQLG